MTQPLRSLGAMSIEELYMLLEGDRQSLVELRPYNGTVPGATAIAETRRHMEMVQREIERREWTA